MLFEDDPVIGIKDPRDYYYMKILRLGLKFIGSWPQRELGEKFGKYDLGVVLLQMFLKLFGLGLTIWHIAEYSQELGFVEMGRSFITALMSCVTVSRGVSLSLQSKYGKIVKKFITEMHTFHFKDKSEYAMKTHLRVHKVCHILCIVLCIQTIGGIVSFNCIPIYNNYVSGKWGKSILYNETFEYALYYKIPFADVLTNRNWCITLCIYNWYATSICSFYISTFDLLLFLMIFNVCGHFKILIHNLNNFPKPAADSFFDVVNVQLYSPTEMEDASKNLKKCINYHRMIVKFVGDISNVFGPMLFIYYTFHQISGCLLLLECSQLEIAILLRYGLLTMVLFQQLIQLSVLIELVGTVTGLLKDAVYNVPWVHMDTSNRKLLIIFLMNVQEPQHINALGLIKIGVQPMAAVLKTSLSYFIFLRSVSD